MKRQHAIHALLLALVACTTSAPAQEANIYDVLSRTLQPILSPFMQEPLPDARAWRMTCVIAAAGERRRVILSMAAPDRLRIDTLHEGRRVSLARRGDVIWGTPADVLQPLLANFTHRATPANAPAPGPFRLPINDAAIVFLPALLQVQDLGTSAVGERTARMADLRLAPELARKSGMPNAVVRVWIDPARNEPLRAEVRGVNGWSGSILFEHFHHAASLPPETWEPESESVTMSTSDLWHMLRQLGLTAPTG